MRTTQDPLGAGYEASEAAHTNHEIPIDRSVAYAG